MDIKLSLKRNFKEWVEVEGVKFKLKYPTINQGKEMERLAQGITKYERVVDDKGVSSFKITEFDTLKNIEYKRYCVRVWIEDWEGMTEDGNPAKCELIFDGKGGQYLEESLWWGLVMDYNLLGILFDAFESAINFSESDKKK